MRRRRAGVLHECGHGGSRLRYGVDLPAGHRGPSVRPVRRQCRSVLHGWRRCLRPGLDLHRRGRRAPRVRAVRRPEPTVLHQPHDHHLQPGDDLRRGRGDSAMRPLRSPRQALLLRLCSGSPFLRRGLDLHLRRGPGLRRIRRHPGRPLQTVKGAAWSRRRDPAVVRAASSRLAGLQSARYCIARCAQGIATSACPRAARGQTSTSRCLAGFGGLPPVRPLALVE